MSQRVWEESTVQSAFSSIAELQTHWESLQGFLGGWVTKHEKLVSTHERHLESLATHSCCLEKQLEDQHGPFEARSSDAALLNLCQAHMGVDHERIKAPGDKVFRYEEMHLAPPDFSHSESKSALEALRTQIASPRRERRKSARTSAFGHQSSLTQHGHGVMPTVMPKLLPSESKLLDAVEIMKKNSKGLKQLNEVLDVDFGESVSERSRGRMSDGFGTGSTSTKPRLGKGLSFRGRNSTTISTSKQEQIEFKNQRASQNEDELIVPKDNLLKQAVQSHTFMAIGLSMIVANATVICVETEYEATTLTNPQFFKDINMALNVWYGIEVVLKLYTFKKRFFTGPDRRWNFMDLSLVVMSVFDSLLTVRELENANMSRTLRAVRLVRLMRNVRLLRYFNFIYDFQRMATALTSCLGTLSWSVLMLACVTWTFAVCLTQFASSLRIHADGRLRDGDSELLEDLQNTVTSMHSLIQSATGGRNWGPMSEALFRIDPLAGFLFLVYIFTTIFGVLNVVTSVFVESALETSQHYRELMVEQTKRMRERYAAHVREIFYILDGDGSGLISFDEIEEIFNDPDLQEFIIALDVNATDAQMLFNLLDYDGSGEINVDEFCDGCLRLKGEAKSFDVYVLMYENERNIVHLRDFMVSMAEMLTELATHVNFVSSRANTHGEVHMRHIWTPTADRHKHHDRHSGSSGITSANGEMDYLMSSFGTERSAPTTPTKFAHPNTDIKFMRHTSSGSNRSGNVPADASVDIVRCCSQSQNISGPCKHQRLAALELLDPPSGAPQIIPDSEEGFFAIGLDGSATDDATKFNVYV